MISLQTAHISPVFKSPALERGYLQTLWALPPDALFPRAQASRGAEPPVGLGSVWVLHVLSLPASLPLAVSAGIVFFFFLQQKALVIKRKWAEGLDENKPQLHHGTRARPALGAEFAGPAQSCSWEGSVQLARMSRVPRPPWPGHSSVCGHRGPWQDDLPCPEPRPWKEVKGFRALEP